MTLCSYQTFAEPRATSIHVGCREINLEFDESNMRSHREYSFAEKPNKIRKRSNTSYLGRTHELHHNIPKELSAHMWTHKTSVVRVREGKIPTKRPPHVGEVTANFCG
jgi:hypothetical protein